MGALSKPASGVKAGTVAHFAASSAPAGWLKANGAAVSRTLYAGLFAAIGTTYGAGDGATTFNLPDLRGEFLRGLDDGRGVDAARAIGSPQSAQNQTHTHGLAEVWTTSTGGRAVRITGGGSATQSGASGGTEARPRNVAMLACIKY